MVFSLAPFFLVPFVVELCLGQVTLGYLPQNFTLSALNTTLPNANHTGAPLVLGQNGASTGISFYVTSTYASYPYNDYPSLGLVNKSLRAYTTSGAWRTNATEITSGGTLGWVTTTLYTHAAPEIYSAVKLPAYEYSLLAVHGFHDLWSLCPFPGTYPQTNVVFNASAANPPPPSLGFDPEECYKVVINIVPIANS
ncbi:hypothetical protein GALMADRAFT_243321 [Galerina marginata CBS 339.88]|uniref:Uncharacterized protein n=1 Tax=Galerina marginata (strain CBS 339.88) TaxID=685588 RepID=A0A067THE5_GALM3|nr:hypothetical protein GALMADRAFT_243321 [Galerina marginata CBS 339.88]